jgi:WD40 repeat protein
MKLTLLLVITIITLDVCSQENETLWTAAWSHDDRYIAIGGDQGSLKLFDGETFELIKTYPVGDVILSRVKWHPTEHKLAVITQSDTFKAKILDLGEDRWIELEGLQNSLRGLDWNHDGELLALSEFEGEISVYSGDGKRVSRFMADPKSVTGIDWHPSKNILTAVGSRIGIYNHMGDTIRLINPGKEEVLLLCVEWHPSGEFFATGDYGDFEAADNKLIQFWNADGEKLMETKGSDVEYRNIRWSPDGKWLASANDALRIWDVEGNLVLQSNASDDYLWGVDWNADGTRIITTSSRGVVALWDKEAKLLRQLSY